MLPGKAADGTALYMDIGLRMASPPQPPLHPMERGQGERRPRVSASPPNPLPIGWGGGQGERRPPRSRCCIGPLSSVCQRPTLLIAPARPPADTLTTRTKGGFFDSDAN